MAGEYTLAVDFGSTYTKIAAFDLEQETLIGVAKSPTTVMTDIMEGLTAALDILGEQLGSRPAYGAKLACSSAAGGLRMVTVGLVPELTAEAATKAALGAGAKVVRVFSYELNASEIGEIEAIRPDIILLTGGTDGGDQRVIKKNAAMLAKSAVTAPIVAAGNKAAADEVYATLKDGGKDVTVTANVMPDIGVLNVEKVQEVLRSLFIEKIVDAKGLKRAELFVDRILMPTPTAVLNAIGLLAQGTATGPGLGEVLAVDIGGATTDVYSAATGLPHSSELIPKGLQDPFLKRTVEGDIGMRYSIDGIVEAGGIAAIARDCGLELAAVEAYIAKIKQDLATVPATAGEMGIEAALARAAVDTATERHAGRVDNVYTPMGKVMTLQGKDLSALPTVIGTGGAIVCSSQPRRVLEKACFIGAKPFSLRPRQPRFYVDSHYILFAVGLLATVAPEKALRIGVKYLRKV